MVAAMLVSPLMVSDHQTLRCSTNAQSTYFLSFTPLIHSNEKGPVMSLTFGTIIADRSLQLVGLKSLLLGIFLSILFGFIFGLILGTTEMPWGSNDWPTDEMKGR